MHRVDAVIIGQGLAGTAMAWEMLGRGQRIAIIDPDRPVTCSKIAAGLVTPLVGARASLSWRWGEMWAAANLFYTELEQRLGAKFWHVHPSVRLYASAQQRADFERRFPSWPDIEVHAHIPPDGIDAPFGAFSMSPAARLDTAVYLRASRTFFQRTAVVIDGAFDWDGGLAGHGLEAAHTVSCQGVRERDSGPFARLNLHPARGDILAIQCDALELPHVVHGQAWLVPDARLAGRFRVGATYERGCGASPNPEAVRTQLEQRLQTFMMAPYHVLDQVSSVRPASYDKKPLLGRHPELGGMWVLNGLGSKGALLAPWCAQHLADAILKGCAVDPALDWTRRLASPCD